MSEEKFPYQKKTEKKKKTLSPFKSMNMDQVLYSFGSMFLIGMLLYIYSPLPRLRLIGLFILFLSLFPALGILAIFLVVRAVT